MWTIVAYGVLNGGRLIVLFFKIDTQHIENEFWKW